MFEDFSIYLSLLLLAIVQGLSEFLPISSSGHLALGQMILGIGEESLIEDIVLHAGTLVAVLVFYRKALLDLARGFFGAKVEPVDGLSPREALALLYELKGLTPPDR